MNRNDGIKLDPTSYGYRRPGPPYTKEQLENRSEIVWNNIRYVKIPLIPGRIRILPREDGEKVLRSVEYIYSRTYVKKEGEKRKTSRNHKAIIGMEVGKILAGWMVPTENYDLYFDGRGKPIWQEEEEEEEEEEAMTATEAGNQGMAKTGQNDEEITDAELTNGETAENEETATDRAEPEPESYRSEEKEESGNTTAINPNQQYHHTAPRSKKQAEQLVTDMLRDVFLGSLTDNKARLQSIPEDKMTEEERQEYNDLLEEEELDRKDDYRKELLELFMPQYKSIEVQAKKHPDNFISFYKIRKINQLLEAVRELYQDTRYARYLELIDEPEKDEEENIISGMTYSDVNILLNSYHAALNDYRLFSSIIRNWKK